MPLKSEWSESEDQEIDIKKQNEVEEEVEDWNGDLQRQKELKEQELKNNKINPPN